MKNSTTKPWRIVARIEGAALFAAAILPPVPPFTDIESEANVYGGMDNPETLVPFWNAIAPRYGLGHLTFKAEVM